MNGYITSDLQSRAVIISSKETIIIVKDNNLNNNTQNSAIEWTQDNKNRKFKKEIQQAN